MRRRHTFRWVVVLRIFQGYSRFDGESFLMARDNEALACVGLPLRDSGVQEDYVQRFAPWTACVLRSAVGFRVISRMGAAFAIKSKPDFEGPEM